MKRKIVKSVAVGLAGITAMNSMPSPLILNAEDSHVVNSDGKLEENTAPLTEGASIAKGDFMGTMVVSGNTCVSGDTLYYAKAEAKFSCILTNSAKPGEGESGDGESADTAGDSKNEEGDTGDVGDSGDGGDGETTEEKDTISDIILVDSEGEEYKHETGVSDIIVSLDDLKPDGKIVMKSTMGREEEIDIASFLDELKLPKIFVKDETKPEIVLEKRQGSAEGDGSDESGYYKGSVVYEYSVTDDVCGIISEVTVLVDGKPIESKFDSVTGKLSFTVDNDSDGKHVVEVTATDALLNSSTSTDTIYRDTEAPEVSFKPESEGTEVDGVGYYVGDIRVNYEATDEVSGVSKVQLFRSDSKDGIFDTDPVAEFTEATGTMVLSDEGYYGVRVYDKRDNLKEYLGTELGLVGANGVAFDDEKPTMGILINGSEASDSWYKDTADMQVTLKDNVGLKSYVLKVNGSVVQETGIQGKEFPISLSLSSLVNEDGIASVSIEVTDAVGNKSSWEKDIKVDTKAPSLSDVSVEGDYSIIGDIAYIKENLKVLGNASDSESGVSKVELLKGDEVVSEGLPATIQDSGSYRIRVTDNVGHVTEKSLGDVMESINDIIFDNKSPVISVESGADPDYSEDGKNWYKQNPNITFSVEDSNISEVVIKLDDEDYFKGVHYDGKYSVISNGEGVHTIEVTAVDKAGNIQSYSMSYYVDTSSPVIESGELKGDCIDRGYGIYYKKNPTLSLKSSDTGVGVKKYVLYDISGEEVEESQDGVFEITIGEYYVSVVDMLGNTSEKVSLASICNLGSNNIVVDSDKPVIECSRPEGDLNSWYSEDVTFIPKFQDDGGLYQGYIEINGEKVASFMSGDKGCTEEVLSGNTSKVEKSEKYTIKVFAEDNSGNTSVWQDTVYVDKEAPVIGKAELSKKWVDLNGVSYFSDDVKLNFSVSDEGCGGVKEVSIYRDGGLLHTFDKKENSYEYTIDVGGKYSIVVEDSVGNKEEYKLSDLVGVKDSIGFDRMPVDATLKCEDGSEIESDWYKDKLNVVLKAEDSNRIEKVVIYINGVQFSEEVGSPTFEKVLSVSDLVDSSGVCTVKAEFTDFVGNKSSIEKEIHLDKVDPIVSVSTPGEILVEGRVAYIRKPLVLNVSAKDLESGLKEVVVTGPDGGESIKDSYTIDKSGEYSISVVDKVGHEVEKSLKDILGVDVDSIVFDADLPVINRVSGFESDLVEDDKNWYSSYPELLYDVKESNAKSVTLTVDGEETTMSNIGLIPITYEKTNGKHKVDIVVVDKAGNISTDTYTFYVDTVAPVMDSGTLNKEYKDRGYGLYFKETPKVTGVAEDDGVGISSYKIFDKTGVFLGESDKFEFDLDSGEYYVSVVDSLGNESPRMSIMSLCGLTSNNIVVDEKNPVITASRPDGDVDGWFGNYVTYKANISDNLGVYEASISVNGVTLDEYKAESVETSNIKLEADLSKVEPTEGVSYDVVVKVEDNAGRVAEWSDSVKVDMAAPIVEDAKISTDPVNMGDTSYFKDSIDLSFKVKDSDCGVVKSVSVLRDGESVATLDVDDSYRYQLSDDGKYSLLVEDAVGNKKEYSLSSLIDGLEDKIAFDREVSKPDITLKDGSEIGDKWYKDSLKVSITATDNKRIDSVWFSLNGKEFEDKVEADSYRKEVSVEDNVDEKGILEIKAKSTDLVGNTANVEKTIRLDKVFPELSGSAIGEYSKEEGVAYIREPLRIDLDYSDKESGVKEVRVIHDGKSSLIKDGSYSIKESGEYVFEVEDNVGHVTKLSLDKIIGVNSIVYDNEAPILSEVSGFEADLEKNGKCWYAKYPDIVYSVADDNIKKVQIIVDGKELDPLSKVGDFSVPYEKKEGLHEIRVTAIDKAGNLSETSYSFYVDTLAPEFESGVLLGDYKDRGFGLYFNENPSVVGRASDGTGVGLTKYKLYAKDGTLLKSSNECNFELGTGEYYLSVVDELGNESEKVSVKDLCKVANNRFVVDGKAPVITSERPSGDVNGWFAGDETYNVSINDNVGIFEASVVINGTVVDTFKASEDVKTVELRGDTSKVSANSDGSYKVSVKVEDNAGNTDTWSDTIYIDRESPVVDRFTITGDGYTEGNVINGSGEYGFFFKGGARVAVHVSDGKVSSGIKGVRYRTENTNGDSVEGTAEVRDGVAEFTVPTGFKGFVYARAVDNVGNVGTENKPDGIISEDSNWHVNSSSISIHLPDTKYKDGAGNNLYSGDISVYADVADTASGLRSIEWGIDDKTVGTVNISKSGTVTGDTSSVKKKDKNLVVDMSKGMPTSGNSNSMRVWVKTVDRAGHTSEDYRVVSIDKDNPVISVSYDANENDNIYNKTRVATVTIKERNFKSGDVHFSGDYGSVGDWRNIGDDTWACNVVFSEDGEYQWSVNYTDMAGNEGNAYSSEKFIIDKTSPVMGVTFNNESPENGNYYNETRVATITVRERNFDSSLVKLSGSGSIGSWSSNGDVHTAQVVFSEDGEYEFSLELSDKAGNSGSGFSSGKFIVDKTMPVLEISGVQDGVSYKKNTGFRISMSDSNIDESRSSVKLVGRVNGNVTVSGGVSGKSGEFSFGGFPDGLDYDDLYNLKAVIYDKAGNYREENIDFSINRYGSQYEFLTADLLGNYINKAEDVDLEETSVDRLDLDSIKIVVIRDGETLNVPKNLITIEETGGQNSPWVYKYHIDKAVFDKDGKYQVQVYSKSAYGDENSSLKEEYSFILDTTPPEIIISGIEDGGTYREVSKKISIEVRDLTGEDTIEAKLVTKDGKELKDLVLSREDGIYYATIEDSSDPQYLSVKVVDKAGNEAVKEVKNFMINTNTVESWLHETWVKGGILGILAVLIILIALLIERSRRSRKRELEVAEENARMYRDSSSGTGSGSSGSKENTEDANTVPMDDEEK